MEILYSASQSFPEIRKIPLPRRFRFPAAKGFFFIGSEPERPGIFRGDRFCLFLAGGAYSYRSMTLLMFAVQDLVFAAMAEAYSKFPRAHWEIT